MSNDKVTQGSVWTHYKSGNPYVVFCVAEDRNTGEKIVVYQRIKSVNHDPFWQQHITEFVMIKSVNHDPFWYRHMAEFVEKFKPYKAK